MKLFLDEVYDALSRDATHEALVAVVRRYKEGGMSQECAYDLLELTWLRIGCHDEEEQSRGCDLLEGVMDVVWGHCPANRRLCENSLDSSRMAEFRGNSEVEEL